MDVSHLLVRYVLGPNRVARPTCRPELVNEVSERGGELRDLAMCLVDKPIPKGIGERQTSRLGTDVVLKAHVGWAEQRHRSRTISHWIFQD